MALTLVEATGQTASGSGTAVTVTAPVGITTGDRLYVIVHCNTETTTVTDNNGATPTVKEVENEGGSGGGGTKFAIFYRNAGGSEPATYTWDLSSSQRWTVIAWGLRGVPSQIFDIAPKTGLANAETSTSPTCPGITTGTDHCFAFAVSGTDGTANGTFTAGPAGWTEIATQNLQQPLSVYYKDITPAGATGAQDFTTTLALANYSLTIFSVRPIGRWILGTH